MLKEPPPTKRKPARDTYDAVLDFHPLNALPEMAYVLIKFTHKVHPDGRTVMHAPEPLQHDLRDDTLEPRLPPGSDFWPHKLATDVVVRGAAFAPEGTPTTQMTCSARVGDRLKEVRVFGSRRVEWRGPGQPVIAAPEPFTKVSMTYDNAYGGIEVRLPMKLPQNIEELRRFDITDHPGIYPRNLHGKGYLVLPEPAEGALMPNLEDPRDLLTPRRLLVGDPTLWHQQPMPWCFDWTNPLMFPRMAYYSFAPPHPIPPEARLPDVDRGFLPADWRERFGTRPHPDRPLPAWAFQEASLGMIFPTLTPGTPVAIGGMSPDRPTMTFSIPSPPRLDVNIDGQVRVMAPLLTACVVTPEDGLVRLTYLARISDPPRVFVPGLHKEIPFSVKIGGDAPLVYQAPVPVEERVAAAEASKTS